jgi:SAM-dependent methyltransferase
VINNLVDPRKVWDERYAQYRRGKGAYDYEPWLEAWQALVKASRHTSILELGCGMGLDARYLIERGYRVIATDYSQEALTIVRQLVPEATTAQLDLRNGLPFSDDSFQLVIASLSLHYFSWAQTQAIVQNIYNCLRPGGFLLVRVNSTRDVNHGAVGYTAVEPNYRLVGRVLKRFFDQESLDKLFQSGWKIHCQEEKVIMHYRAKVIWEIVLERVDS